MARTPAQQTIRLVAQRVAAGQMSADDAAARVAAIRNWQAVQLYRAALDIAARHPGGNCANS